MEAQRQAEASAERRKILHGLELRLVELIGTDGDGGEFATVKRDVAEMKTKIDTVVLFTHRVKWTIGLLATAGGAIAGLAMLLVEHWLGK